MEKRFLKYIEGERNGVNGTGSRRQGDDRLQSQGAEKVVVSTHLWVVVTADVIGSRRVKPAGSVPARLAKGLEQFHEREADSIATPFRVTRGDEIQGVVRLAPDLFARIRRLRCALRPLSIRVGIGVGAIDTPIHPDTTAEMDGPAFRAARRALDASGRRGAARTHIDTGGPEAEDVVNAALHLIDAIQSRWTEAQWEAIDAYERYGTYARAGEALGIALQNVERRCAAAHWRAVEPAERVFGARLIHACEGENPISSKEG